MVSFFIFEKKQKINPAHKALFAAKIGNNVLKNLLLYLKDICKSSKLPVVDLILLVN